MSGNCTIGGDQSVRRYETVVVGTGFGAVHLARLAETGRARIGALVYHSCRSRAEELAHAFNIPMVSNRIDDVVTNKVDLLVVCSPVHTHRDLVVRGIAAGSIVVCDKPLALNVDQAFELARMADEMSTPNFVYFQWRFMEGTRHLKALVDGGVIGAVREIAASFEHDFLADSGTLWNWRHQWDLAGAGALGDLGIHMIDLMIWLLGEVPRVQNAFGRPVFDRRSGPHDRSIICETEDIAYVSMLFENARALGQLRVSRVATGSKRIEIRVLGEKGSIDLVISPEDGRHRLQVHGIKKFLGPPPAVGDNPYHHWFDAIEGGISGFPSFLDGARAQAVMDEAVAKIRTQQRH